jgi:hypothetical protein
MAAFLLTPPGRTLGGFAAALVVIGILTVTFRVWLAVHDRQVIAAQVLLYEKTAAKAKADEEKRQADQVNAAVAAYQRRLAEAEALATQTETDREKGISAYEQRLADLKRQCFADDDDVDFVVRHH